MKYFGKKKKKISSDESEVASSSNIASCSNIAQSQMSIANTIDVDSQILSDDPSSMSMSISALSEDVPEVQDSAPTYQELQNEQPQSSFFENKTAPNQPQVNVFPATNFGKKARRFNPAWYKKYSWLEYNVEKDAAFCFACRVFPSKSKHTEFTFTSTGFRDWKNATDKAKGLVKHASSYSHQCSMENWSNYLSRSTTSVAQSLVKVTDEQKKWLFAVFNVARYLCANGLPFRGTDESDINGDGLFLRLFSQLLFPLDSSWEKIHKNLPKNAKYTSADIQNEVISVLADLVKDKIAAKVREAKLYTVLADGTTDKNRIEIEGLVMRYLSAEGKMSENCIGMEGVQDRSAAGILSFIENTLKTSQISIGGIVSQSYDGASVMSGEHSGLQARMNDLCERNILYIHCFLHKISLVVVSVMKNIEELEQYFQISSSLYKFFKKTAVAECYEGTPLKRLIETRWSGHFDSVSHINKNYGEITQALAVASKSKKLDSDDQAQAIGLLTQMSEDSFPFINCMLIKLLKPINIMVKQLQSSSENIVSALSVVNSVREELKEIRNGLNAEQCDEMLETFRKSGDIISLETRVRRKTKAPQHFQNFILTEHLPAEKTQRSKLEIYAETLDLLSTEFDRRFSSQNTDLWKAMEALSPKSENFLEFEELKPLFEYCSTIPMAKERFTEARISIDDLEAECRIFKRVLKDVKWVEVDDKIDLVDVVTHVKNLHTETAPILSILYQVAITAGWTSTRCECVFSALSRVDSPQRRSMKTKRECDLAYLSFESKVLVEEITFEMFFTAWTSKPRKLDI